VDDANRLERDMSRFLALHRTRWGARSRSFAGRRERLHREFARAALDRGWLDMRLLELDGEPVSCEYGFVFRDAYFAYQGGRDPAWDRYSVGFVVELESVRRTLEEGAGEYRFLGGAETYKYRFPTEDPGLETIVAPASRRGSAAAVALEAAWRFPAGKALLRKIGSART
jgi:CelD/BcsL family acetyltransferase involved in cellulose biosynthesis